MNIFDDTGRYIPHENNRVFSRGKANYYYTIDKNEINYSLIYENYKDHLTTGIDIELDDFKLNVSKLIKKIEDNKSFNKLLKGVYVPFYFKLDTKFVDLGTNLEEIVLKDLNKSFTSSYKQTHFKAILQGDTQLKESINIAENSNYDNFIELSKNGVVGVYFPQVFQEFDIDSQRSAIGNFPDADFNICLSGGFDICSALIGTPGLLTSNKTYSPILCMSSFIHSDPRLVLLLKSYGPHLEFWLMSQMLTPVTKQVSEQWAGGISVF